eukprot:CAMPEP_0114224270 /NCGR_PEP_ID=MMETSP0058-20121206/13_1 /TAXON_ID=36894 /ORGANISM="Pyramimonas parkeae, CCMP726" /LENGTH=105 /DNA_ID=CAMNT_0001334725 /DNA_START=893 /DNA_END=1207 /DNA_ORIENTATION=-
MGSETPKGRPTPSPFKRESTSAKAGFAAKTAAAEDAAAMVLCSTDALHTTTADRLAATRKGAAAIFWVADFLVTARVAKAGIPTTDEKATADMFPVLEESGGGAW